MMSQDRTDCPCDLTGSAHTVAAGLLACRAWTDNPAVTRPVHDLLDLLAEHIAVTRALLAVLAGDAGHAGPVAAVGAQLDQVEAALAEARLRWAVPVPGGGRPRRLGC